MKENGKMISNMDRGNTRLLMEMSMKENGRMIKDRENFFFEGYSIKYEEDIEISRTLQPKEHFCVIMQQIY
jgi:hypothetical protein